MFFASAAALSALPEIGAREQAALENLLPGPVTLLLPNRTRRFPWQVGRATVAPTRSACGSPCGAPRLAALGRSACRCSSRAPTARGGARRAAPARRSPEVDQLRRRSRLDGGELPGVPRPSLIRASTSGAVSGTSCARGRCARGSAAGILHLLDSLVSRYHDGAIGGIDDSGSWRANTPARLGIRSLSPAEERAMSLTCPDHFDLSARRGRPRGGRRAAR